MKKRIGFCQAVVAALLLLGMVAACCSCDFVSSLFGEETSGTEETALDSVSESPEVTSEEVVTRIPVTTKDQSTTESQPDSSETTETTETTEATENVPTPPPAPPVPDDSDTAADAGIGEVLPWNGQGGLQ